MQIGKLPVQIVPVFLPCHAIHSGRRIPLELGVGEPEKGDVHMVQERSEPLLLLQPCSLPYAFKTSGHAIPARSPEHAWLEHVSLGPFPWLHRLRSRLLCVVPRFVATMEGPDFSRPCIIGYGSRLPDADRCCSKRPIARPSGSRARNVSACWDLRPRRIDAQLALAPNLVLPSAL